MPSETKSRHEQEIRMGFKKDYGLKPSFDSKAAVEELNKMKFESPSSTSREQSFIIGERIEKAKKCH